MVSRAGTWPRRPALDHLASRPAPGYQGIVASTSTISQWPARAANCWRLKGAESGSAAFGKILVMIRTRKAGGTDGRGSEQEDLVHAEQLEDRQRLIAGIDDLDLAADRLARPDH